MIILMILMLGGIGAGFGILVGSLVAPGAVTTVASLTSLPKLYPRAALLPLEKSSQQALPASKSNLVSSVPYLMEHAPEAAQQLVALANALETTVQDARAGRHSLMEQEAKLLRRRLSENLDALDMTTRYGMEPSEEAMAGFRENLNLLEKQTEKLLREHVEAGEHQIRVLNTYLRARQSDQL